jgi:two-component system, LytTR family, response regulator
VSLSCIIVDDEPNAVKLLELHVQRATDWQLVVKCNNPLDALEFLKNNKADVIFLDINMPQLNGMQLASLLPADLKIVFITAYSEYAVESYNLKAIDYLLKPITLQRFLDAKQKIEAYFKHHPKPETSLQPCGGNFFVKSGKTVQRICLHELLYFEGDNEYARLVTVHGDILVYKRLKEIAEQLGPPFIRVHNSYIVNTDHIEKIRDNHIYILDKMIPISEKFRASFMTAIQQNFL